MGFGKGAPLDSLPVRCRRALQYELRSRAEYDDITPGMVAEFSANELLRVPNLGKHSVRQIGAWLEKFGLALKDSNKKPKSFLVDIQAETILAGVVLERGRYRIIRLDSGT